MTNECVLLNSQTQAARTVAQMLLGFFSCLNCIFLKHTYSKVWEEPICDTQHGSLGVYAVELCDSKLCHL